MPVSLVGNTYHLCLNSTHIRKRASIQNLYRKEEEGKNKSQDSLSVLASSSSTKNLKYKSDRKRNSQLLHAIRPTKNPAYAKATIRRLHSCELLLIYKICPLFVALLS
jgi:hypothetical protein